MSIPQLETCCCGCTLRTGTKIIGWLSLIGSILSLIGAAATIPLLYNIEQDPNIPQEKKDIIPAVRGFLVIVAIFHLFQAIMSILLLMGAYQNKAQYVLWWVYVSLFVLIMSLLGQFASFFVAFQAVNLIGVILGVALALYLILVVYSFYREIQNGPGNFA